MDSTSRSDIPALMRRAFASVIPKEGPSNGTAARNANAGSTIRIAQRRIGTMIPSMVFRTDPQLFQRTLNRRASLDDACLTTHHSPLTTHHYRFTAVLMQQFLYFFPLPQGHGSLRPTLAPKLRIGSIFFSPWLPAMAWSCGDCRAEATAWANAPGADSCVVAPMFQTDSSKPSLSSSLKM